MNILVQMLKLEWNKPVVYAKLGAPPNNWDHAQCDAQIFHQYALSSFNGSAYDPHSVMHYVFPDNFFKNKPHLKEAHGLSDLDKVWINKTYPGKPLPKGVNPDPSGTSSHWYILLIFIIIALISVIIFTRLNR